VAAKRHARSNKTATNKPKSEMIFNGIKFCMERRNLKVGWLETGGKRAKFLNIKELVSIENLVLVLAPAGGCFRSLLYI
jgi:hypothetical protein